MSTLDQHHPTRHLLKNTSGICLLLCVAALSTGPAFAGPELRDLQSDTWVAVDEAGRVLPTAAEARPPQPDKSVGIFYFLWHGPHGYDQIVNQKSDGQGVVPVNPENEKSPFNLTEWGKRGGNPGELGPPSAFHHWGESENGYYLSDDEWVIRRHIRSLVDAGVDVLILDNTNGFTYHDVYMNLFRIMEEMRAQGEKTPQVAFMAGVVAAPRVVKKLRGELYTPGLHEDLWFKWQDKPLLLVEDKLIQDPKLNEIFTLRKSSARRKTMFGRLGSAVSEAACDDTAATDNTAAAMTVWAVVFMICFSGLLGREGLEPPCGNDIGSAGSERYRRPFPDREYVHPQPGCPPI